MFLAVLPPRRSSTVNQGQEKTNTKWAISGILTLTVFVEVGKIYVCRELCTLQMPGILLCEPHFRCTLDLHGFDPDGKMAKRLNERKARKSRPNWGNFSLSDFLFVLECVWGCSRFRHCGLQKCSGEPQVLKSRFNRSLAPTARYRHPPRIKS